MATLEAYGLLEKSGDDVDPDTTLVDPAYDEAFLPVTHAVIKRKRDCEAHDDETGARCGKKAKHSNPEEVSMKQRIKELTEWKADNINTIKDNNELLAELTMDLVGRLMASEKKYDMLKRKISHLEDDLSLVGGSNFLASDGRTRVIIASKPTYGTRSQHDSQESSSTPSSPAATSSELTEPKATSAPTWLFAEGTGRLPGDQRQR